MKTFAVFLRMKDPELSQKFRPEHLEYLAKRRSEGTVFANGRFVDGAGGLVIYKGENQAQVEEMVMQDPYIMLGAREYEIHEWEIVLASEGN
ncbi:YciI family protein [Neobacillus sp. NRS-1170]|uniref:YciI family protein n=1 Tax=Neobacillus sp. NRS-1170 TaxID=3233898 RepID=UPI003D2874B7